MSDFTTNNIAALGKLVDSADNICIVSHTSPDGDAVGSATGLRCFLEASGKKACIVLPDAFPHFLQNLDPDRRIIFHDRDTALAEQTLLGAGLIICADLPAADRTGGLEQALRKSTAPKVLIDHHVGPDRDFFNLVFSETETSSTCELVYNILKGLDDSIPLQAAQSLFTGMTTDTNNFANSTYPSTLRMASELLALGVDRDSLLCTLYQQFSEGRLRLIGRLLSDGLRVVDGEFAYMLLTDSLKNEYGYSKGDVEGVVNRPLEIAGVRISALFTQDKDFVRVSLRSKKGTAVNTLAAESFNGGGHVNAAGGRLYMDIADVPEYYINAVRRMLAAEKEKARNL